MNHSSITTSKFGAQRGTTLVETLVALLVLSIGLLGVAALQVDALQQQPRRARALAGAGARL